MFSFSLSYASEFRSGSIEVSQPYIPFTSNNIKTAAGYLVIKNDSLVSETLIGVETNFAKAMFHQTIIGSDGVAKMEHLNFIEIPAESKIILAPSGLHIMFFRINEKVALGEIKAVTLKFENAGDLIIKFDVRKVSQK